MIIRDYYKQHSFICQYNEQTQRNGQILRKKKSITFQNWTKKKIENKSRPITSTKIRILIKDLPTNKSPWPDGLTGEFYQEFREELKPILFKILQKITEEGKLPNLFYKAAITLTPKPDKTSTIKKISLVNVDEKSARKL